MSADHTRARARKSDRAEEVSDLWFRWVSQQGQWAGESEASRETDEERMLLLLLLHGAPGMISRRIKIIGSEILRQRGQTTSRPANRTSQTHHAHTVQ